MIPKHKKVPWSIPDIGDDEKKAVVEVIESKWLGMGPKTKELEDNIRSLVGAKYCVVVNNGTSALIAALLANNIGVGDEVLVPSYTFIATINSIIAIGAKPVLVDCDKKTFNVSPEQITKTLNKHPRVKGLIFVDVAGMPADIDAIREIAVKNNLVLIEDAAEAFGAMYKNKMVGSFDHTAIFSFHIAKQVTMVEGGAIVTGDPEVAERCRLIRSHGEGTEKYIHIDIGLNLRPTDIQSAIGIVQLKKVNKYLYIREKVAKIYISELKEVLEPQYVPDYVTRHPWMLFLCLTKTKSERYSLNKFINEYGIETRIPWPPVHLQPYHRGRVGNVYCPNAEFVYEHILSLPIGNAMTESEALSVVDAIKAFYKTIQ
jgi:perosamine synthetase